MPAICGFFYGVRKMPLPNILEFIGTNISQRKFQEAQEKLLNYLGIEVPTKTELSSAISNVNDAIAVKVDKDYLDTALSSFQNGAIKTYPTLSAANADIANIALNTKVSVLSETEGGDYYKATAGATSLTKSPHDPLAQAKAYFNDTVFESALNSGLSVAIIDPQDRRTWLEADMSGKPTQYAAECISDSIGIEQMASPGLSVAIIDPQDRRTWLEADESGKPTNYSAKCIESALDIPSYASPTKFKSSYQTTEIKTVSGPDIVCWGDSMTSGAGVTHLKYTYPAVLQTLMQNANSTATVRNSGCGGETSFTIAARQGGNPMRLYAENGVIPAAAAAVKMVMLDNNGKPIRPLVQKSGIPGYQNDLWFDGTIAGVHGRLTLVRPNGLSPVWDSANYYTFTRTQSGTDVTLNRPAPFYLDFSEARREDIQIFWTGQNNETPSEYIIADTKAMINHLKPASKRYLVLSRPKPYLDLAAQQSDEEKLYLEYGSRFINVRKYLIDYGLADAGITPTSQDEVDIAAGVVPTSLRVDSTHFNDAGYAVVANIVFKRLQQLGWI